MKKALLIIGMILIFFAGCKKDDILEASKVEMKDVTMERGWEHVKMSGEYSYPQALEGMKLYLSEKEDMSAAKVYECTIDDEMFSVDVKDLNDGVTYYYYIEYDNGYTKEKSEKESFKTVGKPIVVTKEVGGVTENSAVLSGSVTNNDVENKINVRGFCWSKNANPTISGSHNNNGSSSGTGTSSFTYNLSYLESNTKYYVRTYARTDWGVVYGEEKSFVTLGKEPETPSAKSFTVKGVSFTMIAVEGGTFQMGATLEQGSDAESWESPVHDVTLSSYYIGETEVTQELWEAVMGSNPSKYSGYPQRPVEYVSWNDCQEFITKLNQLTGKNFRLPTEAEWEYAARGGNKSNGYKYSGNNAIGNVAWYYDNSSSTTHDVKTKQANELGIYDMSGNVFEWCQDWYGSYSSGSQTNPTGPTSGYHRVIRGGSWYHYARYCRVSSRGNFTPDYRRYYIGLRLSLSQD